MARRQYSPQPCRPYFPPPLYDDYCETVCLYVMLILFGSCIAVFSLYLVGLELVYNPMDPDVRVHSAAATVSVLNNNTTTAGSEITATWQLTLLITNPSRKMDLYLETLQATLFHDYYDEGKAIMLSTKPLPCPVDEIKRNNQTTVRVSFQLKTSRAYVGDDVAKEILDGSARLGLKLLGWYHFKDGRIHDLRLTEELRLFCHPIKFGVLSNNRDGSNGTRSLMTTTTTGQSAAACCLDMSTYHYYY